MELVSTERLRSAQDIRRVITARRVCRDANVVVHAQRSDRPTTRVAVVAGKQVGNAVVRNRSKRRLREAVRLAELSVGMDFVVTAKVGADHVGFLELVQQLQTVVRRAERRAVAP